jgi:hypothetical protein
MTEGVPDFYCDVARYPASLPGESDFAIETCLSAVLSAAQANLDVESLDFLVPTWRAGCGIAQS